jgi:glycosyltransferase involved in cell wall biosynthesis
MKEAYPELSFVIPCLNESQTIAAVIEECHRGGQPIAGGYEVVVADNGSSDGSRDIALAHGAHVVEVPIRGYGAALAAGIKAAKGQYVLMGDADSTYEFSQAWEFVAKLQKGYDLVMGNRFQGKLRRVLCHCYIVIWEIRSSACWVVRFLASRSVIFTAACVRLIEKLSKA